MKDLTGLPFPREKSERGVWAPIFFEPILGSGERLTVAVAAVFDGSVVIERAPGIDRLVCLYGAAAAGDIQKAVDITIEGIRDAADNLGGKFLEAKNLAFINASLGTPRAGNGNSVQEILDTALRASSSLMVWPRDALELFDAAALEEEGDETAATVASEHQLTKLVANYVAKIEPATRNAFGRKFRASQTGRMSSIDFVGQKLVANFRVMLPGRKLTPCVNRAKAGLLDLEVFRKSDSLLFNSDYRLFMQVPSQETRPDISDTQLKHLDEAVEELQAIATKQQLLAIPFPTISRIGDAVLASNSRPQRLDPLQ